MTPDEVIRKYHKWVLEVPDFHDVCEAYDTLGNIRARIIQKKRELKRVIESIESNSDRPRSNETKQKKVQATSILEDELADLEASEAIAEQRVKKLEYIKAMISASNYTVKNKNDLGM